MIPFTDATGLAGNALAIAGLASRLPGLSRLVPSVRSGVLAVIFVAALVPVNGLPLAGYLRGTVGDLSVTSLLMLAVYLVRNLRGIAVLPGRGGPSGRDALLLAVAGAAVLFYPLALGWGSFDPYRLGYGHYGLLACLLVLALWAAVRGLTMVAAAIALAVLAWGAGWYESPNLWDYLLDPLVAGYALLALAGRGMRALRGGRRPSLKLK